MTETVFGELLGLHTVMVRKRLPDGPLGPTYDTPAEFVCTINENTSVTVNADGNVTGTVTTMAYDVDQADKVGTGALVTLPSGREAEVISVQMSSGPGVFTGLAAAVAVLS